MAGRHGASDFELEFRDDALELVGSEHTIVLSATIIILAAAAVRATGGGVVERERSVSAALGRPLIK